MNNKTTLYGSSAPTLRYRGLAVVQPTSILRKVSQSHFYFLVTKSLNSQQQQKNVLKETTLTVRSMLMKKIHDLMPLKAAHYHEKN